MKSSNTESLWSEWGLEWSEGLNAASFRTKLDWGCRNPALHFSTLGMLWVLVFFFLHTDDQTLLKTLWQSGCNGLPACLLGTKTTVAQCGTLSVSRLLNCAFFLVVLIPLCGCRNKGSTGAESPYTGQFPLSVCLFRKWVSTAVWVTRVARWGLQRGLERSSSIWHI